MLIYFWVIIACEEVKQMTAKVIRKEDLGLLCYEMLLGTHTTTETAWYYLKVDLDELKMYAGNSRATSKTNFKNV